jgi:hypothetical protein
MRLHPKLLPTLLLSAAFLPGHELAGQQRYASYVEATWPLVPGQVVDALPASAVRISANGDTVYYADGVYFRPAPTGFVVIRAPLGVIVPALPDGATRVTHAGPALWYDRGAFYAEQADGAGYRAVSPSVGCVVPSLPTDVSAIADIDGVLYYLYAGVFYRPIVRDGRTAYEVADP